MASEALDFALATAGPVDVGHLRLAWIKNTSTRWEMFVSEILQAATEGKKKFAVLSKRVVLNGICDKCTEKEEGEPSDLS